MAWPYQQSRFSLSRQDVHIWQASLLQPHWKTSHLYRLLAADEQTRARRFRYERHRRRFVVARAFLRLILGRYLGTPPAQVRFSYGRWGKPAVILDEGQAPLWFNLSHSQDLALYAVTTTGEIGVDLEYIRPIRHVDGMIERFLTPREGTLLRTLPADQRLESFFTCWTCKEALAKAKGIGLSLAFDRLDILPAATTSTLLQLDGDETEAQRWKLERLKPSAGFAGAVAAEGHDWRTTWHLWPG